MSDTNPNYKEGDLVITLGRYKISKFSESSVWIEDTVDGDAGEFHNDLIDNIIGEFYKKNL